MQRLVLIGATGNLGLQTLDILRQFPGQFRLVGIAAYQKKQELLQIADEFDVSSLFLTAGDSHDSREVGALEDLIDEDCDHVIVLDHGLDSYKAVLKALAMKKRVSVANKELVIAHGAEITYLAREQQCDLIPLDSEHNALFQCLQGEKTSDIARVIITASGGPFRGYSQEELDAVSKEDALNHPTWDMGAKTTLDSATLVNKAFEVIEAHYLFDLPYEKIEVRLHPQSIIHAIIEFHDGSSKLLAYQPHMKFPLAYALFYPERCPEALCPDQGVFEYDHDLVFSRLETGQYPCFDLVLQIAKEEPEKLPIVLENDQRALRSFLNDEIRFRDLHTHLQKGL